MKTTLTNIILIAIFVSTSSADTTFVDGDVSGVWGIEGNPYVILNNSDPIVPVNEQLVINPGVNILIDFGSGLRVRGKLEAIGTEEDSIYFKPLGIRGDDWANIVSYLGSDLIFDYCQFINGGWGYHEEGVIQTNRTDTLIVRHSSFINCAYDVEFLYCNFTSITNCWMDRKREGVSSLWGYVDFLYVNNCVFYGNRQDIYGISVLGRSIQLSYCLFDSMQIEPLVERVGDIYLIENCIFSRPNFRGRYLNFSHGSDTTGLYKYNCFLPSDNPFGIRPPGMLINDRVNANGDSTDCNGNLFLDPGLVGGDDFPDRFFLTEDSPCIDAGDPESPLDPDSTVADMGPFYFSQPNIALSTDSLVFPESIIDDADTVFFTIRNRGDRRDLRYYLDAPDLSPEFWLFDWNEDTASLAAGESIEIAMQFLPRAEGDYFDTLTITSNDRDEGVFRLPIRGSASNVGVHDSTVNPPRLTVLLEVSPNPFNSTVTILFGFPPLLAGGELKGGLRLAIYDVNGREVADLLDGRGVSRNAPAADQNKLAWDASEMPAGIYIARLEFFGASGKLEHSSVKLTLLR